MNTLKTDILKKIPKIKLPTPDQIKEQEEKATVVKITDTADKPFQPRPQKHKVGITLSGGGALGFAHLGVLHALEEINIHPTCISGSSMGSLVGFFYASGMTAREICKMVKEEKLYQLVTIFTPTAGTLKKKLGLSSHKSLIRLFNKYFPYDHFEQLSKEFGISVCNISKQRCEYPCSGEHMKEYVLASMSQPGIFNPILINGDYYIDGGTLDNMPTCMIRDRCETLIGVDVHGYTDKFKADTLMDVALRSIQTLVHNNSLVGRTRCDFLIEPSGVEKYTIFDFEKFVALFYRGYNDAVKYIAAHPEILKLAD